jgi:uncharacterized protein (DUF433 family)
MVYLLLTYKCYAMKITKRQNFNITPEQEAEIAQLKEIINAPTTKDAILSAVRFYTVVAGRVKEGQELYMSGNKQNQVEKIMIPDLEVLKPSEYKYLIERPHAWKRQLCVKGRRLPAATVYGDILLDKMSPVETAANWDLPLEAVYECIRYCKENESLIRMESEEERRLLAVEGIIIEDPPAA